MDFFSRNREIQFSIHDYEDSEDFIGKRIDVNGSEIGRKIENLSSSVVYRTGTAAKCKQMKTLVLSVQNYNCLSLLNLQICKQRTRRKKRMMN